MFESEGEEVHLKEMVEPVEEPAEFQASEAERMYANLLMRTDFSREFIEEMLEFEPNEEQKKRIEDLRRERRELERQTIFI